MESAWVYVKFQVCNQVTHTSRAWCTASFAECSYTSACSLLGPYTRSKVYRYVVYTCAVPLQSRQCDSPGSNSAGDADSLASRAETALP